MVYNTELKDEVVCVCVIAQRLLIDSM